MRLDAGRDQAYVHYNGWPTRWDEWISCDSARVAPFRTRTLHSTALPHASPCPVAGVQDAPRTGTDDIRTVLPELQRLLRALMPSLDEAALLARESIAKYPLAYDRTNSTDLTRPEASNMPWLRSPVDTPRRKARVLSFSFSFSFWFTQRRRQNR